MNKKALFRLIAAVALSASALAQTGTSSSKPSQSSEDGKEIGGYQVQQSIELGYRFTDVTGSQQIYSTFLNQNEGPRLLEQSISMRSLHPVGMLFDRLNASSFGWGGDPENAARLQMSKNHFYDFSFSFRRDKNYFDYDLLANPLNPTTSVPNVPVPFSPHSMYTTRRMYDASLTVLPESKISIRLGFSRNRSEGPAFSSFHEGTDPLLNQLWNVTSNDYFIGFDVKVLPRTTISYDQAIQFDRNDTDFSLAPFAPALLADGTQVSLGLPFNTAANQPCKTPILVTGFANSTCNLYISYLRNQRVRTTTPTERLSFRSDYFRKLNIVGQASYSSANLDSPYFESFNGLVSRTGERLFTFTGPASVRRFAFNSYAGVTWTISDRFSLSDNFRFDNFHIPGQWNSSETITLGAPVGNPPVVDVLLSPLLPPTTTTALIANLLGQKSFSNEIELAYSPSKYAGVRIGYRFRHRRVFKAEPEILADPESGLGEFEGDTLIVNEQTPIIGVWLRPMSNLRISGQAEATAADNFITRISPRQKQNYKARLNYKPVKWATIAGSADITESHNGESDTQFDQHYRNAGFVVSLLPNERVGVDVAYNYTNALQDSLICYNGTFNPPGTILNGCPTFDAAENPNPNQIHFHYLNETHYFNASVRLKPLKRLTAVLGYGLTQSGGDETTLNPLQPFGTLQFTYHQPIGSLSYEFAPNLSLNALWNYDQYGEDSFAGPTNPRYFHDNRTTLSMRYSF